MVGAILKQDAFEGEMIQKRFVVLILLKWKYHVLICFILFLGLEHVL